MSRILLLIIAKRHYKYVINLDVVTKYYGFVTCYYNEIHKLCNHSNDASCKTAFYHTGWYYEYRETFRHVKTAVKIAYCYVLWTWILSQTQWTEAD